MKKTNIALVSAMIISTSAFGASTSLDFTGTVSSSCAFSSVGAGTLALDLTAPNILSTSAAGGAPGTVNINYIGTPTITVDPVTSITGPQGFSATPAFSINAVSASGGTLSAVNNAPTKTYSSGNQDVISVGLAATLSSGNSFPVGNYTASTTVTCQ